MSILSLRSGYGGLELAIQAAFGPQNIDAVCDNYKPARQVLTHHHPTATIHNAARKGHIYWNRYNAAPTFRVSRRDTITWAAHSNTSPP